MTVRQLLGDCRVTLPTLAPGSVQSCITSPPYYGLRDYGTPHLVWGGDAEHAHEWSNDRWYAAQGNAAADEAAFSAAGPENAARLKAARWHDNRLCACHAWFGSLGLEPTPELYIEHIIDVFRHVRRVLRDDGVLWLNLGDSYAGSGNGQNDHRSADASPSMRQIGPAERGQLTNRAVSGQRSGAGPVHGYKAKDLMLMPFRVAMALQADGWWLRSVIPWIKRNSMPESVTDRPATAVEYVFLLSKASRYFWDPDAVRVGYNTDSIGRYRSSMQSTAPTGRQPGGDIERKRREEAVRDPNPNGRGWRNSDLFFESWQGLLLDEQDDPLALVVNPAPFSGAHFATFPPKLVEPMIKASTRPGDTILDPFGGAGTVGLVADRLGRNAVLCELSDSYSPMAAERITQDAPLFTELE